MMTHFYCLISPAHNLPSSNVCNRSWHFSPLKIENEISHRAGQAIVMEMSCNKPEAQYSWTPFQRYSHRHPHYRSITAIAFHLNLVKQRCSAE